MRFSLVFLLVSLGLVWAAPDPTNYEFYASGGVKSGLSASTDQFALNGKHIVLYSGSFHYFRVVPEYWKATLARFRAAGLNSVELYLPWNLHEETKGKFDFTSNGLNLDKFLEEIKAADMFAIVRIGPYICAEWEWGGFPAWLYRDPNVVLRTNNKPYLDAVASYWTEVMKIVNKHTFSDKGGPIIMLQIENEYYGSGGFKVSVDYLHFLHDFVMKTGFKELLFTSDPVADRYPIKDVFPHHDVLETLNGNHGLGQKLLTMKTRQVNRPGFVSEFWPGWFDAWGAKHHARYSMHDFELELNDILFKANSSVNFYMFIGGTNFGFTNGGRIVTSYDYDAPLSESGNYTAKYHKTREVYQKLVEAGKVPKTHLPEVPPAPKATAYPAVKPSRFLPLEQLLSVARKFSNVHKPVHMENLPEGQNFGFVLYRAESKEVKNYEVTGPIHDRALFLVDGAEVSTIEEKDPSEKHFSHAFTGLEHPAPTHKYDLLVENQGRTNYGTGMIQQQKGVASDIKLDGQVFSNFTVYSLDFKQDYVGKLHALSSWHEIADLDHKHNAPAWYSSVLNIDHEPVDTFVALPGWTKGNLFVNGFNLGRYWSVGPTKTLYLPAPILHKGANAIDVFELHKPGAEIHFQDHPQLE